MGTADPVGTLYVVTAPSGAGKTSLVKALVERVDRVSFAVSYTTRPPREEERDGEDYFFIEPEEFERLIDSGELLEYACVFGNYYGTPRSQVERLLHEGQDVILEIDWQGASQVRESLPEAVSIFILPPSRAELESRLRARGQDDETVVSRRLTEAVNEMQHHPEFDYLVVNDAFATAVEDVVAIFRAVRLRTPAQRARHSALLADLLG